MRVFPALLLVSSAALAVEPHRSATGLPSSNGFSTIVFDVAQNRLTTFLEHPYRYPRPNVETRDFLWDSYPGVRVGEAGTWLPDVAPDSLGYLPGSGIIEVRRTIAGVAVDEYDFTPMSLEEHAYVTLLHVRGSASKQAISAYLLMNLHLGAGSPAPGSDGEGIQYNAPRDAFYEYGPSGVAIGYGSLLPSSHHTAPPSNPYGMLRAGQDLDDAGGRDGWNDAVAGFQSNFGTLGEGEEAWIGWYVVLADDAKAQEAVDRVKSWIGLRGADQLLADEVADWNAWAPTPKNEADFVRAQSEAVLRMAQVREPGKAHGQLLASLPPGQWNIAWVRDMAYATVALVRTGHLAEARKALQFQVNASAGTYRAEVGGDYRISLCRYFGEGLEESDSNGDGPNVEFDGFGLFLWALDEYARAGGDVSALWPAARDGVADVLVRLQAPNGLISADSSIWEVHWNGQQKHFAYTTITAALGLDAAADLAGKQGDSARSQAYRAAAAKARDAVASQLRTADGVLVQSTEALQAGVHMMDGAVLDAFDFGVFRASGETAAKTLDALREALTVPTGRGLQRNQWDGHYDRQEWVFVDLRLATALALANRPDEAQRQVDWVVAQARENFNLFAELHDRDTGDYDGSVPMVGFGAGAYLLYATLPDQPVPPIAGAYARDPNHPPSLRISGPEEIPSGGTATLSVALADADEGDLAAGIAVGFAVDGAAPTEVSATNDFTREFGPFAPGAHVVAFTARDRWGAIGTAELHLLVDADEQGRRSGCGCDSAGFAAFSLVALLARRRRVLPPC